MRLPCSLVTRPLTSVLAAALALTGVVSAASASVPTTAVSSTVPPVAAPSVPAIDGFLVKPYLTHPGPDRMSVMFEPKATSVGDTMAVEFRGPDTRGWVRVDAVLEDDPRGGPTRAIDVYRADLTGLKSNTRYEYRVVTAAGTTPAAGFKTWPDRDDPVKKGRFISISDIQLTSESGHLADTYVDILTDVVDRFCGGVPANCRDSIDGIIVPGDLVNAGRNINEWRDRWFGPADFIFRHVPQIPAIGNHDTPIAHYLYYFDAPSNGSAAYDEEWHSLDFMNMKLVTLQSSVVTTASYQLQNDFLAAELEEATQNDQDYVFMQFHHPCKSELWIPGESAAACNWVRMAEKWSKRTGKTSGHLYGHTHAYSRGQSRDVPHLWMNVAAAGGAVDDWGDYEMADYDEMDMSWDEHGYVAMEFATGGAAKLRFTRHTAGDDFGFNPDRFTDATVRDDFTVKEENAAPRQPTAKILTTASDDAKPSKQPESIAVPDPILYAAFDDADDRSLYEAHWQVRANDGSYAEPLYDTWGTETRRSNVWFDKNRNEGIDNEYWRVPALDEGGYCYRVRHRDEHWAWSGWSDELCFTVGNMTAGPDLVTNGGGEDGTTGWTVAGRLESLNAATAALCTGDGISTGWGPTMQPLAPHRGSGFFSVGGCSSPKAVSSAQQTIDVSQYADLIDAGSATGVLRAATRTMTKWDAPTVRAIARGADGGLLDITRPLINQTDHWADQASSVLLPPGTRSVDILLTGHRQRGGSNDSFVDDVRFNVVGSPTAREPYDRPCSSPANGMAIMTDWNETWPVLGDCGKDWNDPVTATLRGTGPFAAEPLFAPGGTQTLEAEVTNPSLTALTGLAGAIVVADGWTAVPAGDNPESIPAGGTATMRFEVTAPAADRVNEQARLSATGTRDGEPVSVEASLSVNVAPNHAGALFGETFDGLADQLQPGVEHNGTAGTGVLGWTRQAPEGWTITDADGMPQGTTEMQGWSLMSKQFWAHGDDQERTAFSRGMGVVAVADPDEWDDVGDPDSRGRFDSTLATPSVRLPDGATKLRLRWDNHYREEEPMEAEVVVEFDTGQRVQVVHWTPATTAERAEMNKEIDLPVQIPAGASTAKVHFRAFNAMNDWYWAIDNIRVDA